MSSGFDAAAANDASGVRQRSLQYQLLMLGLSVYVLAALAADTLWQLDPETSRTLQLVDFGVCFFFLGDFFVGFVQAERKLAFLKWGWIDLVSSIPSFDPLRWGRLARIVRILRFLRTLRSLHFVVRRLQADRTQSAATVVTLVAFFVWVTGSVAILEFERHSGGVVNEAPAALWWTFTTIMGSGYD